MEFFTMCRNGVFVPGEHTKSQCAHMGHVAYNYRIRMLFEGDTPLDKQNLIIDHVDIDDTVVKTAASGSCEQMHPNICEAIKKLFADRGIPLLAYKCTIFPGPNEGAAFMSYIFISSQHVPTSQRAVAAALLD